MDIMILLINNLQKDPKGGEAVSVKKITL